MSYADCLEDAFLASTCWNRIRRDVSIGMLRERMLACTSTVMSSEPLTLGSLLDLCMIYGGLGSGSSTVNVVPTKRIALDHAVGATIDTTLRDVLMQTLCRKYLLRLTSRRCFMNCSMSLIFELHLRFPRSPCMAR